MKGTRERRNRALDVLKGSYISLFWGCYAGGSEIWPCHCHNKWCHYELDTIRPVSSRHGSTSRVVSCQLGSV